VIDTHCHLTDPRLHSQLAPVLARAHAAGVDRLITISTNVEDAKSCIALCRPHVNIRCTVGIHPNYSAPADLSHVAALRELLDDPAVVAMGEMGLDYHHKASPPAHQAEIFEAQLSLAADANKPVVIHCREAVTDTLRILSRFPRVPTVFHCFTGTADEARRILAAGYLIGFTGVVTYKKSEELREVARFAPLHRILVETDAPYLTPEPMRKIKTNEPSYVIHTAAAVAQARGMRVEEIDRATTDNACRFFNWPR
jgi:TatD DNase family protein